MERSGVTMAPHANIGPRGCKRRGTMAWAWLAVGVAVVAVLVVRDAPVSWRVVAAIPFLMAALGYFQAKEQTCVFYAAVGQRNMDGGAERITDPEELSRARRHATGVWVRATIAALGLTAAVLLIAALVD